MCTLCCVELSVLSVLHVYFVFVLSPELLHVCAVLFVVCVPKRMPEMSDILFLSGISGLWIEFPLPVFSLVLLPIELVMVRFLFCHYYYCYFYLLMVHALDSPTPHPQKLLQFILREMALVQQLGDDSWYVVCTACCHTALTMVHLYEKLCFMVSVHYFLCVFCRL